MSRFSHLEFDRHQPAADSPPAGESVRDEYAHVEAAHLAWLAGNFEQALREYSRALGANNVFLPGWSGQLRMLIELDELPEALLWADKALELFPEHPELLAAKAVASARNLDFEKAIMYSDNAMSREHTTGYIWLARGEVLLAAGHGRAELCMDNALNLETADMPALRLEVGRTWLRYRRYVDALGPLRQSAVELPESALAWYALGACSAALGLPEAAAHLDQALQLQPGMQAALRARMAFQRRGPISRLRARLARRPKR